MGKHPMDEYPRELLSDGAIAFVELLKEFEVECRAILPRRRWLIITNRSLSGREETGEALLAMECLRWLEKYHLTKLVRLDSNVLRSLLLAVRSELNTPTTDRTLELKKTIAAGPHPGEHGG